jgi:hypothetical protein
MQTNTRVHNTDQKEGNVMNSTPNLNNNHKEKRMNIITTVPFVVEGSLQWLTDWLQSPE